MISNILKMLCFFIVAIIIECTVFNVRYYATLNIAPIINYDKPKIINSEQTVEMHIVGINEIVRTVYLQPSFWNQGVKKTEVEITFADEDSVRLYRTNLIRGYSQSFIIPLDAFGNMDNIIIKYRNQDIAMERVSINMPFPFIFKPLRAFIVGLAFCLIYFSKKQNFEEIIFNPVSKIQRAIDIFILVLFIGMLCFVSVFSQDFGYIPGTDGDMTLPVWKDQINDGMVMALEQGNLYLPYDVDESLSKAEYPYSPRYRQENGVAYMWDVAYFDGKYYCYFGIVPIILFYLPFHLLTGEVLSSIIACLGFCIIASIGIYFLYREIILTYVKKITYTVYLARFMCFLFCADIILLVVRPAMYESTIAAGIMFVIWGVFFLIHGISPVGFQSKISIFFSALCLALSVGCRPTLLLFSFLTIVLVLPHFIKSFPYLGRDRKITNQTISVIILISLPYMVIGAGLMFYNYKRFGSAFDFGSTYLLTVQNLTIMSDTGLLGTIRHICDGVFANLLTPFIISYEFPFIFFSRIPTTITAGYYFIENTIGIAFLPCFWILFGIGIIFKNKATQKALPLLITLILISACILLLSSILVGAAGRYQTDFLWAITLTSIMCLCYAYQGALEIKNKTITSVLRRTSFVFMGVSSYAVLADSLSYMIYGIKEYNPIIWQYLTDFFIFF